MEHRYRFRFLERPDRGSVDLYLQNTNDLLMDRQLPVVSGFGNVTTNIGQIRNKGLEVTLNTVNIDTKDFKWDDRLHVLRQQGGDRGTL